VVNTDTTAVSSILADPRLGRLLTIAQQMNDLLSKIQTASTYLSEIPEAEDFEAIYLSKIELGHDFNARANEARHFQPAVDEIILNLKVQKRELESKRQMSLGLAKIEGLSSKAKERDFINTARRLEGQHKELESLIRVLEAFTEDLSTPRRTPVTCPRCGSPSVSYQITPSDFGFTLYKCNKCTNAWKTTSFTIHLG
jgi:DNA-directed RNA polymerase subunit M/transcription elongation factor TFIIS